MGRSSGTITLELFCNFVVVTSTLPPQLVQHPAGGIDYLDYMSQAGGGAPEDVVKQLSALSRKNIFPSTRSSKVAALLLWGELHPRSGFRTHCRLQQHQDTAGLLVSVLILPSSRGFKNRFGMAAFTPPARKADAEIVCEGFAQLRASVPNRPRKLGGRSSHFCVGLLLSRNGKIGSTV